MITGEEGSIQDKGTKEMMKMRVHMRGNEKVVHRNAHTRDRYVIKTEGG